MSEVRPQAASGADPVRVDSKHYKVIMENEKARVLRISYGPREKSVMHYHPESIAIMLKENHARFTLPDGKSEEIHAKAGDVQWIPAGDHLPENLTDQSLEVILIELKR
jgi:quercetin dioxygenase-like cupin family protein